MNGSESGDYKNYGSPEGIEKDLLTQLSLYPSIIEEAAAAYDPSSIAAYAYQLSRSYHRFYHDVRILKAETPEAKAFRLALSKCVARNLKHAMAILGIEMPEKM
jgi:arginyl-tRNA synthetase